MGLPFFSMGYLLQKFRHRTSKWNNGKLFLAIVSVMVLYLLEIAVVVYCRLQDSIVITLMLYLLVYMLITVLLNNRLPEHKTAAELLRKIANFTYYSHPIVILLCGVFGKVTNIKLTQTPTFVVTWILTFVAGFIIAKINKKWLNQMIM